MLHRLLRRSITVLDHLYFPIWHIYLAGADPRYWMAAVVIETSRYRPVRATSKTTGRIFIIANDSARGQGAMTFIIVEPAGGVATVSVRGLSYLCSKLPRV